MKRRGFLAALLSGPVVASVPKLPVLLQDTPQAIRRLVFNRVEWVTTNRGNYFVLYNKDGSEFARLGVW